MASGTSQAGTSTDSSKTVNYRNSKRGLAYTTTYLVAMI